MQSPRPFGIKGLLCQVHHDLYITRLSGEPFRPCGQRDAAADQATGPCPGAGSGSSAISAEPGRPGITLIAFTGVNLPGHFGVTDRARGTVETTPAVSKCGHLCFFSRYHTYFYVIARSLVP